MTVPGIREASPVLSRVQASGARSEGSGGSRRKRDSVHLPDRVWMHAGVDMHVVRLEDNTDLTATSDKLHVL